MEAQALTVARSDTLALDQVSFSVAHGEVFALLGGNGAGKSTTLLTFLGFLSPTSGAAFVEGREVGQNRDYVRRQIAYLPERATLYTHLSARENLAYLLALASLEVERSVLENALDAVGLDLSARSKPLSAYSKGMRQKVAIALALLRETPLLLLDEPTSGLDPIAIDDFNSLVRKLADDGRTVLMVTHDVYGACQVADRIGLLRGGKLVGAFSATDDQRIDTEAVHAAFAERAVR
ncbi:MAG: ATP-binding cassette domain-containing protein [Myxococcota bacterium]